MSDQLRSFKTIREPAGPVLLKEKNSKFLGWAFPLSSREEAATRIAELWKKYPDATHICYAYRLGIDRPQVRINDDGEPANSAGSPIFGQIESASLYNVLVCVVRYYGGTKLGVGGLIQAYRQGAKSVLEQARIYTRTPLFICNLEFEYDRLDLVMRLISQLDLKIREQKMGLSCSLEVEIAQEVFEKAWAGFVAINQVKIQKRITY